MIINKHFQHTFTALLCVITCSAISINAMELDCDLLFLPEQKPLPILKRQDPFINEIEKLILQRIPPQQFVPENFVLPQLPSYSNSSTPPISFSPCGNYLFQTRCPMVGAQNQFLITDNIIITHIPTKTSRGIRTNYRHNEIITTLTSNDSYLISGTQQDPHTLLTIQMWNYKTPDKVKNCYIHHVLPYVTNVKWNPTKDIFVSIGAGQIFEHHLSDKYPNSFSINISYLHGQASSISYCPDGNKFVSVSGNKVILCHSLLKQSIATHIEQCGTNQYMPQVAWHPFNDIFILITNARNVANTFVFNGTTGQLQSSFMDTSLNSDFIKRYVQFSPDGKYVITINFHPNPKAQRRAESTIAIRNGENFNIIASFFAPIHNTSALTFSNDGKYLIFAVDNSSYGTENSIYFYDLDTCTVVTEVSTHNNIVEYILCRPHSNQLIYIEKNTGIIKWINIFDPETENTLHELKNSDDKQIDCIKYLCDQAIINKKVPDFTQHNEKLNKLSDNIKTMLERMFPNEPKE